MTQDALAAVRRWEQAGGTWKLREARGEHVVVDLITCDGGEVMDQVASSDPEFVAYVQGGTPPSL